MQDWETAVIGTQLDIMAREPDSLIARKCGQDDAKQSQQLAKEVLNAGWPSQPGQELIVRFDNWLRANGHRRNPGTTADLIAAILFAVIRDHLWTPPKIVPDAPSVRDNESHSTLDSPMNRTFSVDVTKDHLVFSAGHFITIGNFCERLHGHNFRLAAQVEGTLDANGYVFDFIALRDELQRVCDQLDHRMLLPLQHPEIIVDMQEREIEVRYTDRRWVFPREECILLPIKQTTVELIAEWIGTEALKRFDTSNLTSLTIKVEENFGQWANCRFEISQNEGL